MADNYLLFSEVMANLSAEEEVWLKSQLQWIAVRGDQEIEIEAPDDQAAKGADWAGPRFLRDDEDYDPDFNWGVGFEYAFYDDDHPPQGWGRHLWMYSDEWGDLSRVARLVQKFLKQYRPGQCWSLSYATTCSKPRVGEFGGGGIFITADAIIRNDARDFVETQEAAFHGHQAGAQP